MVDSWRGHVSFSKLTTSSTVVLSWDGRSLISVEGSGVIRKVGLKKSCPHWEFMLRDGLGRNINSLSLSKTSSGGIALKFSMIAPCKGDNEALFYIARRFLTAI